VTEPVRHAYVHVPFCRHRCGYCDFTLVAGRDDLRDDYAAALSQELTRLPQPLVLDTLYFGGGTPSHFGPDGLRQLFQLTAARLQPGPTAEVTVEANPLDVTAELIEAACECGVTRVSLGSQSLNQETLAALDRDHQPDDVCRAVKRLLGAGLTVSVDLLIAAPGQTLNGVKADLEATIALGCQHVSVYCLTWEPGTDFFRRRQRGLLQAVPEGLERAMFEEAIHRLERAGYRQYEVSNFARPGGRCRHNEAYWDCRPWEAFGPGAARFDGRTRKTNHRSPTTWIRRIRAGQDATGEVDEMNAEEAARERLVLGLRRRDGIDCKAFAKASGYSVEELAEQPLARWVAAGLAVADDDTVRLTHAGLLVSDSLWSEVL